MIFLYDMSKVVSKERFFDFAARGVFGRAFELGEKVLGQGLLGEEEIEALYNGYGVCENGYCLYGSDNLRWGLYQQRNENGRSFSIRTRFVVPKNPRTETQQNWRAVFIAAMAAWKLLTENQKSVYNERAKRFQIHGVNLFVREWLNSNK